MSAEALVERGTRPNLVESDWQVNLEIIDLATNRPSSCSELSRCLGRKVRSSQPNVCILAVVILESLVKNCPAFEVDKELMSSLIRALPSKVRNPGGSGFSLSGILGGEQNDARKTKLILSTLQSWGEDELYKGSVNYKFFKTTILELRKRGIRFPSTIEETRRKKSSEAERIARRQGASSSTSKSSSSPVASSAQTRVLAKYTDKDCSTGAEIALLLVETLSASSPREDLQRNELVTQLVRNAKAAQARGAARIQGPMSEDAMVQVLAVNDELVDALGYYEGLVKRTCARRAIVRDEPAADPTVEPKKYKKKKKKKKRRESSSSDSDQAPSAVASREKPHPTSSSSSSSSSKRSVPKLAPPPNVPKLQPPPSTTKKSRRTSRKSLTPSPTPSSSQPSSASPPPSRPSPAASSSSPDLLNIVDFFGSAPAASAPASATAPASSVPAPSAASADPFDMFFGAPVTAAAQPASAPAPAASGAHAAADSGADDFEDEFLALAMGRK